MACTSPVRERRVTGLDPTTRPAYPVHRSATRERLLTPSREGAGDGFEGDAHPVGPVGQLVRDLVHGLGHDERVEDDLRRVVALRQQRGRILYLRVPGHEGRGDVLLPARAERAELFVVDRAAAP